MTINVCRGPQASRPKRAKEGGLDCKGFVTTHREALGQRQEENIPLGGGQETSTATTEFVVRAQTTCPNPEQ